MPYHKIKLREMFILARKEKEEEVLYNEKGERVVYRDAPKKKNKFLPGCLGLVLLMLIIGACAAMGGEDDTKKESSSKESTTTSEKKETKKTYKIGDTVKVGKMEYKVNGVSTTNAVGTDGFGEKAKGTYQIVDITVKNNGDDAIIVDSDLFKLKVGSKTLSADGGASITANDSNNSFFLEELNPDSELTGKVVFDVSNSLIDKEKQLEVSTGFFGTEKDLIDLK